MTEFLKQLKAQINVAEVVGEYVRLRKVGTNHMGLCPFHAERSPSFSVVEKKGIYHCFGCHRGGDVISFVQEIQAVSFHEAIRILASKFNIPLPADFSARARSGANPQARESDLEVYYKLNRFVAQFYHETLLSSAGKGAREYLADRGISEATIRSAYLGYAPNDWSKLYDFLVSKKAPLDKAEELGLIRKKNEGADGRGHYDLFRDRVIFPVTDLRGRVIAFGGRALGETDGPKYLNSPETPVYKKGSHLFGIFAAQKDIRAEDVCVVVEGFMDCLSLQQAGIGYAVATLGTALTEQQVKLLKRFTRNMVVLFDGDSAGQEAQERALEVFLGEDVVVRGAKLPDELDPDEFVRERGVDALSQLLRSAPYLLDQKILDLASKAAGHAEARGRAVDLVLPLIAKISSDTARMVRVQDLSNLFDIEAAALERRLAELRRGVRPAVAAVAAQRAPSPPVKPMAVAPRSAPKSQLDALDARAIELIVQFPAFAAEAIEAPSALDGLETEVTRKLVIALLERAKAGVIDAEVLEVAETNALKAVLTAAFAAAEQEQARAQSGEERKKELLQELKDLNSRLVRRGLERQRDSLRATIRKAEGSGQLQEVSKLMIEYDKLVKSLERPKEVR